LAIILHKLQKPTKAMWSAKDKTPTYAIQYMHSRTMNSHDIALFKVT